MLQNTSLRFIYFLKRVTYFKLKVIVLFGVASIPCANLLLSLRALRSKHTFRCLIVLEPRQIALDDKTKLGGDWDNFINRK